MEVHGSWGIRRCRFEIIKRLIYIGALSEKTVYPLVNCLSQHLHARQIYMYFFSNEYRLTNLNK